MTTAWTRNDRAAIAVLAAAMAVLVIYGVMVGSDLTWVYLGMMVVLAPLVAAVHRRVRFSDGLVWALVAVGIAHFAGGIILLSGDRILYNLSLADPLLRYDKVLHASATGVATVAGWHVIRAWSGVRAATPGLIFVAVMMANGIAALVEIGEYIGSINMETDVGDYENNMLDLVANLFGSIVAGVWLYNRDRD